MVWGYKSREDKFLSNVRIGSSTFIDHPQNLTLGDHVYIGHHNFIEASHHIEIAEGCQITNYINITTHSSHQAIRLYGRHYTKFKSHVGFIKGSIRIGAYSFIGPHSVIMPETNIGKGSVVAAYSYIQGTFPDFSILKGNPAKIVGNTKEKDNKMLEDHPDLRPFYQEWQ